MGAAARAAAGEGRLIELDHVLFAVPDLEAAAAALEATDGLASLPGGRHPGWGTANRIVPLGAAYFELIAVVDEQQADASAFGRWVAAEASASPRPFAWAVRTDDLDAVAARLGLTVGAGSRERPDGSALRWRIAGVEEAAAEPPLPFFIEWSPETELPGAAAVEHPRGPRRIAALALTGDAERLDAWLGPHDLPVTVRPGAPRVVGVSLA